MLDDQQFELICSEVRSSVKSSFLAEELIDHLCCSVEHKIEQGGRFSEALEVALAELCNNNIAEIEKQTILVLTLTKSYPMKKLMYLSGFLATTSILIGFVFLILHWPGAPWIMLFGHAALFICMLSMLFRKRNSISALSNLRSYSGIISGILIAVGGMFKIMHWPTANIQMVIGMFLLLTVVVPAYFWQLYKSELITS